MFFFVLGFKEFEASTIFKEQLYRKKFCLDFLSCITFLNSSLVAGGLQEEHDFFSHFGNKVPGRGL